ncbi:hypothetical protein ATO8_08711 [Roseivivax marinus]|jgi:hypothetical protein|uniref:Uncharacterized protein n=1 Tax=Roseivivax marinus TaxID=1379903 RepID=W4HMR0_9RHOB|nr:hypothetical protein [Roseivivax marinus]ETW13280.1 hypothetical protein ATO8_08711 [Roseivivax marinus]UMA66554.1 hypothetical protein LVO79_08990 [Roseivivax marinus]SEK72789.1 hypothetical protein SAMN05444413_103101 [Roseivivax marinus]
MGRILKWLFYLVVLAVAALVVYAYAAPFFGVSFAPEPEPISVPVELDVD